MPEQRTEKPSLSIVIPAYNEADEDRLPASLREIVAFVERQDFPIEVIVVNNNSTDATQEVIDAAAAKYAFLVSLFEGQQGKGAAVRTGMLAAKHDYLFICDADLSMTIDQVLRFLPPQLNHYDIAIASREGPGAKRVGEPEFRHVIGRIFNLIVQVFAVRGFRDTQCGFKSFRREIAHALFPLQTIDGWTFDVELLHIAQKRGYHIVEVPITWYYKEHSKIKPFSDAVKMFRDVLRIRWNSLRGKYRRPEAR
ncbi:MAG: glycosyltransferase family 2 protein [Chloroflexi bacterium]|nr:glycosyltransferase family 2 protein [Chloroflexota bacterium]